MEMIKMNSDRERLEQELNARQADEVRALGGKVSQTDMRALTDKHAAERAALPAQYTEGQMEGQYNEGVMAENMSDVPASVTLDDSRSVRNFVASVELSLKTLGQPAGVFNAPTGQPINHGSLRTWAAGVEDRFKALGKQFAPLDSPVKPDSPIQRANLRAWMQSVQARLGALGQLIPDPIL